MLRELKWNGLSILFGKFLVGLASTYQTDYHHMTPMFEPGGTTGLFQESL
jgi:hypothetical protein